MAQIILNVTTENLRRYTDALVALGFDPEEGETGMDHAKRWARRQAMKTVFHFERETAVAAATATVIEDPDVLT